MKAIKKFIMMLGIMLLTGNVCLGQDVATYSDEVIDENGNVDLSSFNQLSDLEYKTDENGNVDISFVFDATNAGTKIAELVRIYYFYEDDDESVFGRRYISVMSGYGLTFISKECEDVHTERLVPDTISKVTVHNPEFLDKDKKLKSIARTPRRRRYPGRGRR